MSQHDFDIANQGFAAFRADLNNALKALGSVSSGTEAPTTTYANQLWYETDTNTLHIRDEANAAWLDLMVIDQTTGSPSFTAGSVGIGTSSPAEELHIQAAAPTLRLQDSDDSAYTNFIQNSGGFRIDVDPTAAGAGSYFRVDVDGTEHMRIDASGSVGVGTASPTAKLQVISDLPTAGSGAVSIFDRQTSTGEVIRLRKDGTTLGSIGVGASSCYFAMGASGGITQAGVRTVPTDGSGAISDDTNDLGSSTVRWDDIYATNNVIQTSDRNEKQDIEELSEAERRVAVACKGLLRKYRWKNAVAEKGDAARIHFGIIAQDLQAAFAAEGLDAGRYAMFISSTWWEHEGQTYDTAEEAPEGSIERTRLGVRYPELLAFIIAAL